ncbi:SPFH domain-containing protein [Acrocarpospora catenulata]|uniref:SPFH domain-containing protein n=1 Tax=Acrocarpospora catenulata TaxID=2836182 RepID=UPI001BD9AA93|nr:SPFH domain-containing protein [Acrocarpospora catenulata]
MSLDELITWEDWAPRSFPVDATQRVVLKHNGRARRVLGPGRHGPFSGVPIHGHLGVVVFRQGVVRHTATIPRVRLRDGAIVTLTVTALVRLALVDDEELIEWVEEYDAATLSDPATLREEFDRRLRRALGDLDYQQARRHGLQVAELAEERVAADPGEFLEIVRVESAVLEADPVSEVRRGDRRAAVLAETRDRAESLAWRAREQLLTGAPGPLDRLRVRGWADHTDRELEALDSRARDYALSGDHFARPAAYLIGALAAAGEEDEEKRARTCRVIASMYAWELLWRRHGIAWEPVVKALGKNDLELVAALTAEITDTAVQPDDESAGRDAVSVAWRLPRDLVKAPRARTILASFGVGSRVAGCHTGPAPQSGKRWLYVVSDDVPGLLDGLDGERWRVAESAGADRLQPLPLLDDPDETVRAWFHALAGPDAAQVTLAAEARGGLVVRVSPEVTAGELTPAGAHAFAEALAALTGMPRVVLARAGTR